MCINGTVKLGQLFNANMNTMPIQTLTLLAVGAGIAPMINILRYILTIKNTSNDYQIKVTLLYGVVSKQIA